MCIINVTDHLGNQPFIVLRNTNSKYPCNYNSAVVSTRNMGLAPEILMLIPSSNLMIVDGLPCLIFGGFYWQGCVISGVTLIMEAGGWGE